MKSFLLTGATGLIGSHLVPRLAEQGKVYALVRQELPKALLDLGVEPIEVDLNQSWQWTHLPAKMDAVFHLAQSEHFRDFPNSAQGIFNVNVGSTMTLLDYAHHAGASHFIFASTGGVYGYGPKAFAEEDPWASMDQLGFYVDSKRCSELLVQNYAHLLTAISMRFFFVYGPGQRNSMLIPRLVQSVQDGKAITLQGESGIAMNPIQVNDAVAAIVNALNLKESHVLNVAGPEVLSLREIGETIGRVLGKTPEFQVDTATEPRNLIADTQKMNQWVGAPQTHFEEGVRHYVQHLAQQLEQPLGRDFAISHVG
jgi:UDP-glucose 4-epimerase